MLTIDLMHCGVRFLLCEVLNYAFPLLTMHVLVFELLPSNPTALSRSALLAEDVVHTYLKNCQCLDAVPRNPGAPVDPALVGSIVLASSFEMLDLLAEI